MKPILFLLGFCCSVFFTDAQEKTTVGLSYHYALPVGAFKSNFVGNGSGRGLGLDLLSAVHARWRIGAGVAYQDFYEKMPRRLYSLDDGSVMSAVMSNSVQTTTIMAKAMYLPLPGSRLQPFVNAGLGLNVAQVRQLLGVFDNLNDVKLAFAAQGGAGVKYGLGEARRTHLTASVLYNHLPFQHFGIGQLSHLSFGVGARFTLRQNGRPDDDGDSDWNRPRRPRHYGW